MAVVILLVQTYRPLIPKLVLKRNEYNPKPGISGESAGAAARLAKTSRIYLLLAATGHVPRPRVRRDPSNSPSLVELTVFASSGAYSPTGDLHGKEKARVRSRRMQKPRRMLAIRRYEIHTPRLRLTRFARSSGIVGTLRYF